MAKISSAPSAALLLQDGSLTAGHSGNYAGAHALAPVLLGLSVPAVLFAVLVPGAVHYAPLVVGVYLMALFVIASILFVRSVFNPGFVISASFDPASTVAEFVRSGTFGTTSVRVPFSDIASVRMEMKYDDDGYKVLVPTVDLRSNETVELPAGASQTDIEMVRAVLEA